MITTDEISKIRQQLISKQVKQGKITIDTIANIRQQMQQPVEPVQLVTQPVVQQPVTPVQQPQVTSHAQKAQEGYTQAKDKLHETETKATPMTDKINSGASLTPEEVIQLAKEKGILNNEEANYQLQREKAKSIPRVNNYANQENYEKANPVHAVEKAQGKKDAEKVNVTSENAADEYVKARANLEVAKSNNDQREISKNEAIVDKSKQAYNGEKPNIDITSLGKHISDLENDLDKLEAQYNKETDAELKNKYADEYNATLANYNSKKKAYNNAVAYDEIKNNNMLKDIGESTRLGIAGGVQKMGEGAYAGGSRILGTDASTINATELLKFNNNDIQWYDYVNDVGKALNPLNPISLASRIGGRQIQTPNSAYMQLATIANLNPDNIGVQKLFRDITNHTYKGTAEDLRNELDKIQKELYQNYRDVSGANYVLGKEREQLAHNENVYGNLAAIPNAFNQLGNQIPSMVLAPVGGENVSLAAMATGAGGSALDEALESGARYNQGFNYGVLSGATEFGTEKLFGSGLQRAIGIKGTIDPSELANKFADSLGIKNRIGRAVLQTMGDVTGESLEEMISETLNPLWKYATYDQNAFNEFNPEQIIKAGIDAIPSTLLMEGMGAVGTNVKINSIQNGIIKSINQSKDLSPIVKNQLINEVREAAKDVKLGLQEEGYIETRANEKLENLTASSNDMKARIPQGYTLPQSTIDILAYTENNRPGLNIAFDTNIQGNGTFVENPDGTRTITLNPNSKRAVEFTLTHELGHDLKGTQEYTQLQNLLTDYAKGKPGYQEALKQLDKTYKESGANYNLQDEATNDMLGQAIGEQEFYNKLAENPTLFNRVTNGLKNLLGNKDTKLKNKIEKLTSNALKQEYRGKQEGTQQSLSEAPSQDNQGRELSKGQQSYFRDSKIKDVDGKLLTMYHGTNGDFYTFDLGKIGNNTKNAGNFGDGFYFTYSKDRAKDYGKNVKETYLNIQNPFSYESLYYLPNGTESYSDYTVITNLVNMNNEWGKIPIKFGSKYTWQDIADTVNKMSNEGATDSQIDSALYEKYGDIAEQGLPDRIYTYAKQEGYKTLREALAEQGYDGIIDGKTAQDSSQIVAFNSNQIKNIDNQNPTENEDIRYQKQNQSWQQFLDKNLNLAKGTKTNFEGLPSNEELRQAENTGVNEILKDLKVPTNEELTKAETKSIENEPIVNQVKLNKTNDDTLFSLSDEETKEINDYIGKLNQDTTIDENFKEQVLNKFDNLNTYKQFEDIKKEVQDYKDRMYDIVPKQRKHISTLMESEIIPDEVKSKIKDDARKYYEPQSNQTTLDNAKKIIGNDYAKAEHRFLEKELNTAEDVGVADILIQKAIADGDYTKAAELSVTLAEKLTQSGQVVQAASMIKRFTPEGMLIYAEKQLNNAVDKIKEDSPKFFEKLVKDGVIEQGKGKPKINLTENEVKTITDNMEKAQKMEDGREKDVLVAKTLALIGNKIPATVLEKVAALRRNGLLMNLKTLNRNIGSDLAFGTLENLKDVPAAALDKVVSFFTGKRTTTLPNLKAAAKGFIKEGKYSIQDLYYGIDTTNGEGSKYELPSKAFKRENTYKEIAQAFKNLSIKDGTKMAFKRLLSDYEDAAMFFVNGTDRPFWKARFESELANQMKLNGLKYEVDAPTKENMEIAKEAADYATFKNKNVLSSSLSQLRSTMNRGKPIGLADAIGLTFTNVPGSVGSKIYDYTAGGYLKAGKQLYNAAIKNGKFSQRDFVQNLARSMTGTAGVILLSQLISKGILTGSYDDDKDKADLEREMGIQKNAINLTAFDRFLKGEDTTLKKGDKFYNFDWIQPVSGLAILGANLYKKASGGIKTEDEDAISELDDENEYYVRKKETTDVGDLAMEALATTANQIADMSSLGNFSDLFKGYEGLGGNIADIPGNFASSFIPTISNNIGQFTDETQRNTKDYTSRWNTNINKMTNKLPGARETLEPKVNTLGEEKLQYVNGNDFVSTFLNPGYYTTYNPSDIQQELMDVYNETGDATIFPSVSPGTITSQGESVRLKPKGVTTFQKASGQYASELYDALLDDEFYKSLEASEKAKVLKMVADDSRDIGKAAIGIKTKNYNKLDTDKDYLERSDIPLVDYYMAEYAYKNIAKAKTDASKEKAIRENVTTLNSDQMSTLYKIFDI